MKFTRRSVLAAAAGAIAFVAAGAASAESARKIEIDALADGALETLYAENPGARELAKRASGILIIPKIVKGGFIVGGQTGDGVLRVKGEPVGYYNLSGASFGFQAGIQSYSQVLMFLHESALEKFRKSDGWEAGVDGSVAVLKSGVTTGADTTSIKEPIVAFMFGETGLMASASIEGTKYSTITP